MILLSNIRDRATASVGLLRLFSHGFACRDFISLSDFYFLMPSEELKNNPTYGNVHVIAHNFQIN